MSQWFLIIFSDCDVNPLENYELVKTRVRRSPAVNSYSERSFPLCLLSRKYREPHATRDTDHESACHTTK
jgi:hypothetical protein